MADSGLSATGVSTGASSAGGLARLRAVLPLISRIVAAVGGGYALAALASVAVLALPVSRIQAVIGGMLGSFAVYAAAVVWVFAVRSATRALTDFTGSHIRSPSNAGAGTVALIRRLVSGLRNAISRAMKPGFFGASLSTTIVHGRPSAGLRLNSKPCASSAITPM